MTLVDTNVLLDIATSDANWREWSLEQLETASLAGPLIVNSVVYAELAARYDNRDELDNFIGRLGMEFHEVPLDGLFLAGKVFQQYRRRGGTRTGVLSDFFIGAHAAVAGLPLLTRDRSRYATYFPDVQLIAPEQS